MKIKYLILFYALSSFFKFSFSQDSLHLIATMSGEQTGDRFSVVAGVGDVNGDGYDDLVVGAPGNWNYPGSGNYTKLYFGASPFDTVADLKFVSNDLWRANFGSAVAGDGDLNGDGFSDILIGDPGYGDFQPGRVYVYFGGTQMDTVPDLVLEEFGYYYNFGQSVSMAGDVNNDGYDDLIVGAPNDDYDARGRTYIYFGGTDMDSIADVLIEGQEEFDSFGWSVSGVGDVNKDNYDDILIGATQDLKGGSGKAYLIYGGEEIGFNLSVEFNGDSTLAYDTFGMKVSTLDDINGDSFIDFGILSGSFLRVISGRTLEILQDIHVTPEWQAFQSFSEGGDLNNDDYSELLLGIENESIGYAGTAAIYFGSEEFDTIPEYQINGNTPFYYFASSLDYAGDINGDNYKEIIIGRREYSGSYVHVAKGTVYIYSFGNIDNITEKEYYSLPKHFKLFQNYPNPFNSTTSISYQLNKPFNVSVEIINCKGQKIKTLLYKNQVSGNYTIHWDGTNDNHCLVSSGIYYIKISFKANNRISRDYKKMVLLK